MNRFDSFLQNLQEDLSRPLPGEDAQYRMAPRPRRGGERDDKPDGNVRRGAVLLLFYPHGDRLHLPFILRPTYNGAHSGQVAFPGGGYEEGDSSLATTALREAYEEIGVKPSIVRVLGKLSPLYVNVSNYLVQPIVGWSDHRPRFRLDPFEVDELLEIPFDEILRPPNRHVEQWTLADRSAMVPFFRIDGQVIWGATAMMLSELMMLASIMQMADSFIS